MSLFSDLPLTSAAVRRLFRHQLHLQPIRPTLPHALKSKVALYLHIPFCESLCTYCTFHRVLFSEPLARAYFAALREDIRQAHAAGWQVSEVYIGGGTPTVLVDELCATLTLCQTLFAPKVMSVETNPNHLVSATLTALRAAGVNRLSVGVQSLDNTLLRAMNRFEAYGSAEDILPRLALANAYFDTFNVDMIFNLPGQSVASLQQDALALLEADIKQISWYPLMPTRQKTSLLRESMGAYQLKWEHKKYQQLCQVLGHRYTLSSAWCFNRNTVNAHDEYVTQNEHYLGLGSGAFSYVNHQLLVNDFNIERYIETVQAGGNRLVAGQHFTPAQALSYRLLLQLFSLRVAAIAPVDRRLRKLWSADIAALKTAKMIQVTDDAYEVTEQGRYLALALMREFYVAVNTLREQMRELQASEQRIRLQEVE